MNSNNSKIYGEDFSSFDELQWYLDEEKAYKKLRSERKEYIDCNIAYEYHDINSYYGFLPLLNKKFSNVLIFGSSTGVEGIPIIDKIDRIYLADSEYNISPDERLKNFNVIKLKSTSSVKLKLKSNHIDLVTCFGVLHHICKPSKSLGEIYRVMKKGSLFLIREPITSMNFHNKQRIGCTPRERGLPYITFEKLLVSKGFKIEKRNFCFSPFFTIPLIRVFLKKIRLLAYIDDYYCNFLFPYPTYQRKTFFDKFRPSSCFWILRKV